MAITSGFDPEDKGSIPLPSTNRGLRRFKTTNIIASRKKKLKRLYIDREDFEFHKLHKWSGVRCSNTKCIFCRNPRKTFGDITIPEVKANVSYKQQMQDIGE